MKKLKLNMEFSSLPATAKWLVQINVSGFSSRKPDANQKFITGLKNLIDKYVEE